MDPLIGIDLGTTHSAVAILTPEGVRLIPNSLGENLTPSVIALDDQDSVLVGAAAKEYQVLHPDRCASQFKRHMGTAWNTKIGKRTFTPEELSSLVLASLKRDAEQYLGGPVAKAVITVPAYFNDRQRKATIAAGQIAGLEVQRILNEPTAAAIAYGLHEGQQNKTILIFDLGGGTFDVSIVEFFEGTLEVRASSGENFLGGEDFTRSIASMILEKEGVNYERAEMETPKRVSRLLQLCEMAKRKLSSQESVRVAVPNKNGIVNEDSPSFELPRTLLVERIKSLLARTELPVRRVLNDTKLSKDKLDEVILVGGATRMPIVRQRVKDMLGREPQVRLNPDEVVAMGAAVQAGLFGRSEALEDLVVTDVAPFTLGVEVSKELGNQVVDGYFSPVIERNTTIPVSRVETFATIAANQPYIEIRVFQGDGRKTENNLLLGSFQVKGIPPGPRGQEVTIRFTYDLNGVLEVEATVVKTGRKTSHVITSNSKQMSPHQIQQALREMANLKIHPRESEVNRYVLLRAERLYAELPRDLRERLSMLMDAFEDALNRQDPGPIDEIRGQLDQFLSAFDPSEKADEDEDLGEPRA